VARRGELVVTGRMIRAALGEPPARRGGNTPIRPGVPTPSHGSLGARETLASIGLMAADDRLRVCIVTRVVNAHAIGGMQQHTEDLARGLLAAGHEVTVLTPRLEDGSVPAGPPGLRWALVDVPRPEGPYTRAWGRGSAAVYAHLAAGRPFDVVHSESTGALGLVKAGLPRDAALVVKYHGNFHGYARAQSRQGWDARPRWHGLLRAGRRTAATARVHYLQGHAWAFRDVESMVPARSQVRDTLRSQHVAPERLHVVPNGVDTDAFAPGRAPDLRRRWEVPAGARVLLTLGRLARDKGNDHAVRALADLPEDAVLVVVGDGEEREALARLAGEVGVAERVRLPGAVAPAEVPRALRAADVFWFPTLRDEAAGLVLTQAMATGLPVVASRIGGIPDYVGREGEDALLVPPGDPWALAAVTRELLDAPEQRTAMGSAARAHVSAEFSLARTTERTVDVYRMAIARREGAAAQPESDGGWAASVTVSSSK
jgi:glycogen(starch) synthase